MTCVFCKIDAAVHVAANEHFFAIRDKYPVSRGHTLIISRRHVEDYFSLNPEEVSQLHALILSLKNDLDQEHRPSGYNLAMNCGSSAGQSVMHFHLHIIPRYGEGHGKRIFRRVREGIF